jgi:hypothetical protein
MIGCHELRVDEVRERAIALRFPLDVTAALRHRPSHSLLHATAMISRHGYFKAGGLSTDQIVANDTQFLFRAYFNLRIRNCDEFLYLRRSHEHALTIHPSTGNQLPLRYELDKLWRADFEAIKQGRGSVDQSSLRPTHRTADFSVTSLGTHVARIAHQGNPKDLHQAGTAKTGDAPIAARSNSGIAAGEHNA